MQNLELREMLLVSHKEKRARRVIFHPIATLIRGANDTGKSCLIKSIYHAFGASPCNMHPLWRSAVVSSLIRFAVDSREYEIFRQGASYSLFSGNGELIGTYASVTNELGPKLASIFDFKLQLVDHKNEPKTPPPSFLFLPFYIDQDGGWSKNWASFENLSQFRNWRTDLVYYHTGMRPNRWYELKSASRMQEIAKEEPLQRERVLRDVMKRLEKQLSIGMFDIDLENYKKEIDQLLIKCEGLRKREEEYRDKIVELETERMRLKTQQGIVTHARRELTADYKFATEFEHDYVECPTCGASYSNSFAERFVIACDEDRCLDLLQTIQNDLMEVETRIDSHRRDLSHTTSELNDLNEILAARLGEVTLGDLIKNEGKRHVTKTLEMELCEVQAEIAAIDTELRKIQEELSKFTDRKRSGRIVKEYSDRMRQYLYLLNVTTLEEKVLRRIDATIKESGSDLPRAVLAYVFSILHVIKSFGSSLFCPIIIDAPRQQEQDSENHQRMLELIRDKRPEGSQLILGLVDDCGIDFAGNVIEMQEKNFALSKDEYDDLAGEIAPYSKANLGL